MKLQFPHKHNDPRYARAEREPLPPQEWQVTRCREDERTLIPLPGSLPFSSSAVGLVLLQWREFCDREPDYDRGWRLTPREAMRLSLALHVYAVAISGESAKDLSEGMTDELRELCSDLPNVGELDHVIALRWILEQARVR